MSELIETWRGEALAWEADELGHMNMRYYLIAHMKPALVLLITLAYRTYTKPPP